MGIETKYFNGRITETKQIERNGIPVGIIKGYIATWDVDRGNDKFIKGCFAECLAEMKRCNRQVRLKDNHGRVVGGFPIDTVFEDSKGLYGEGEINLDVQQGRELFSLCKQGVICDFSIGYSTEQVDYKDGIRSILKAICWEGSAVEEPMNPEAKITEVKAVNGRGSFPKLLTENTYKWDVSAADKRIREKTNASEEPNTEYKNCHLWFDPDNQDTFGGYKFLICDVIDDEIKIVPRAVFSSRAILEGARGGANIADEDKSKIKKVINKLYEDMGMDAPYDNSGNGKAFCMTEIKNLTKSEMNYIFRSNKCSREVNDLVTDLLNDFRERENKSHVETDSELKTSLYDLVSQIENTAKEIKDGTRT